MGKYLAGLWLTIVAPFIGMIVIGGPDGGVVDHLVLHIAMIILGAISLWILVGLRRTVAPAGRTPSRGIGVTCVILLVVQVLFLIGNAGEAAALIRKGGFHLGEAIFHDPLHYAAAWITPNAFMLAILGVLVLSVQVLVVTRRLRAVPGTPEAD
ncbi:MAG: hypothetical protein L0K84_07360 [Acidipropionibacterium jensenii]|nr:hypothetical protein [Acidipropionibacterium jensenii]